jgi:hypothetical protein
MSPISSPSSRPSRFHEALSCDTSPPKVTRLATGFEDFVPPERLSSWKVEDEKKAAKKIVARVKEGLKGLGK